VSSLQKVEVNVIRTLKGDRQPGKQIIATDHFYPPMKPGKKYLLSNSGGSVPASRDVPGTDFLAADEISVVNPTSATGAGVKSSGGILLGF
jgi:hypothetical protein